AYPVSEWQELERKVAALPQFLDEVKALQRVFISAAVECPLDGQGRILIPAELREYAAMQREVMVVGMTKRIEFWSVERWDVVFNSSQQRLESLGQKLAELGL
ncbi:MAG: cell division/cell wall cluster transcriptional repressor MraZ, partial [Deltaproteobacteria bacterium]|nr:cell division/cell wall cluster transcriptional repressor MraZ [Deltaproteobacteria bacterium]